MTASQTTMDKLYGMRMSVMAQAYRDQEESQGVAEMTFDERFAMIVDSRMDARRINRRYEAVAPGRLLRSRGEHCRCPLRRGSQARPHETDRAVQLHMDKRPPQRRDHGRVGRRQELDCLRARGGGLQRLLQRKVRPVARNARRAEREQERGLAQGEEALHEMRLADTGRLVFWKSSRGRRRASF